ncbi:MAG TPA: CotH kinase family protein [Pirellulales bacterium]
MTASAISRSCWLLAVFVLAALSGPSPASAQVKPLFADASDPFFANVEIPQLRLTIKEKQLEKLKADPRTYVKATLRENDDKTYEEVGVKLKGAAGSYRDWDDRPALTLNMRKFNKNGSFHDLDKFHLNNSVQDETYLNEWLASDVFRRAGIPTPRVTYARVWLNDRDVGLYVLKESFDEQFLKRYFPDPSGNLYEGAFVADIDSELEKDAGDGPDDRSDLQAVVSACREPDPAVRVRKWESLVDVNEFLKFMAIERLVGHWDGYTYNGNNYRIYFPPSGKAVFLPHGMDQTFGDPGMSLFGRTDWMVCAPVLQMRGPSTRYRQTAASLVPLVAPEVLLPQVDSLHKKLRPVLEAIEPSAAEHHAEQVAALKDRIVERAKFLPEHVVEPPEAVQEFDVSGELVLTDWYSESEVEKAKLDEVALKGGKRALHIRLGEPGAASWRKNVLLGPGLYVLSAQVRARQVVKQDETEATGIGVGVSGAERPQHLQGTFADKPLSYEFVIREDFHEQVLVLELRGKSGQAWFDLESLKLTRKPVPPLPPAPVETP